MVNNTEEKHGSYANFSDARIRLAGEGFTLSQDETDQGEGLYRRQLWFRASDGAQVVLVYESPERGGFDMWLIQTHDAYHAAWKRGDVAEAKRIQAEITRKGGAW